MTEGRKGVLGVHLLDPLVGHLEKLISIIELLDSLVVLVVLGDELHESVVLFGHQSGLGGAGHNC